MKSFAVSKLCNPSRLSDELAAAGVPLVTVRASWSSPPPALATSAEVVTQDSAVDATVNAVILDHDGAQTTNEKLDGAGLPMRVLATVVYRLSGSWAAAGAAKQQKVQTILDAAGTRIDGLL